MSRPTPLISDAAPDDLGSIRDMLHEYETWLGVDLGFQRFAREIEDLPGAYAPPSGALLIARLEQEPAGMVALRRLDDRQCEMKRLYVRTQARGAGVGRHLVERVIAAARTRGYREMVLDTLPVMQDAQRLYAALGFRDIAPYYASPIAGTRYMALSLKDSLRS
jgi:putative acetyltransferase